MNCHPRRLVSGREHFGVTPRCTPHGHRHKLATDGRRAGLGGSDGVSKYAYRTICHRASADAPLRLSNDRVGSRADVGAGLHLQGAARYVCLSGDKTVSRTHDACQSIERGSVAVECVLVELARITLHDIWTQALRDSCFCDKLRRASPALVERARWRFVRIGHVRVLCHVLVRCSCFWNLEDGIARHESSNDGGSRNNDLDALRVELPCNARKYPSWFLPRRWRLHVK